MEFLKLEKVKDGKYLKNYEITYRNKSGKEKKYEIVSRRDLADVADIGGKPSGVSIVATCQDKLLLLHEFRMGVNRYVYNLCAGMLDSGLHVKEIKKILPASFAAVAFSDTTTYIAFAEVEGSFEDHTSENEQIEAKFYTKAEVKKLLDTEPFSSRAQMAAYFFSEG